jgi:hypothetical protein
MLLQNNYQQLKNDLSTIVQDLNLVSDDELKVLFSDEVTLFE